MTQQVTSDMLTPGSVASTHLALGAVPQIESVTASVASNALTLTLNPVVSLDFRAPTLSSGTVNSRSVPAAISLVVPAGATLGTANATQARLVMLAIDNAGTVELTVVNLAGGVNLDETTLINTTAISASATAANVVYSTTARSGVPFRVVGSVDITETTAGTWATAPTAIQGAGGQALDSMGSIGYGQTWQAFTSGTRALGTNYVNTTAKPIMVAVSATSAAASTLAFTVGGVTNYGSAASVAGYNMSAQFIVPPGAAYSATTTGGGTWSAWSELR